MSALRILLDDARKIGFDSYAKGIHAPSQSPDWKARVEAFLPGPFDVWAGVTASDGTSYPLIVSGAMDAFSEGHADAYTEEAEAAFIARHGSRIL